MIEATKKHKYLDKLLLVLLILINIWLYNLAFASGGIGLGESVLYFIIFFFWSVWASLKVLIGSKEDDKYLANQIGAFGMLILQIVILTILYFTGFAQEASYELFFAMIAWFVTNGALQKMIVSFGMIIYDSKNRVK